MPWRVLEPREAAPEIVASARDAPVAILFGAERTGLSNEDIEQCQRLLTIPSDEAYPSLNLAMAVQIVAYELRLAARHPGGGHGRRSSAARDGAAKWRSSTHSSAGARRDRLSRSQRAAVICMARLRRLFNRAAPDQNEINILRGILTAVQGRRRRAGESPRDLHAAWKLMRRSISTMPRRHPSIRASSRRCSLPGPGRGVRKRIVRQPRAGARAPAPAIETARAAVAALVGREPEQVVWTSGATEANNLALLGAARFHRARGRHIVTSRTEHPAVLDACRQLEREGFDVTYLQAGPDGIVEPAQVEAALRPDTMLVSLMHVNNETGVVQDVGAVGALVPRARRAAARRCRAERGQACRSTSPRDAIDLLALTAHKVHGPKGIGALCIRREPRLGLVPLQFGGGQERGLRSGTLPTHQIVGHGRGLPDRAARR